MIAYLSSAFAAVAAWAAHFSPAQWVVIGLIALLMLMLIAAYFQDFWLAVEKAFEGQGVGKDDMADVHERTWPEYWQ